MPFRRRFARRSMRSRPHYAWARQAVNNVSPVQGPSINHEDLLSTYRSQSGGIIINLPEITVWRIHLKISIAIKYTSAAFSSADSVFVGLAVLPHQQDVAGEISYFTNQFSYQYLVWDELYVSAGLENVQNVAVSTTNDQVLYKEYDIKARRRFRNLDDDLVLQIISTHNTSFNLVDYSYTSAVLLRSSR